MMVKRNLKEKYYGSSRTPKNAKTRSNMLTAERGAAMNTRQAYWRDLADVTAYLRSEKKTDLDKATTEELKAYIEYLTNKIHTKGENKAQIAVRTVARRLSAMRQ